MADETNRDLLFLYELEALMISRKNELPEGSYTSSLYKEGIDKIAQKLGEEAVELVIASKNEDQGEIILESADLIYHLLVLLAEKEIPLDRVIGELKARSKGLG
jgi:phosphoribosyl-ATP pyrophosphohydrolase